MNNINEHAVDKVIAVCQKISNGRTISSVMKALEEEVVELRVEVDKALAGEDAGTDGIVGEAIDCLLCVVDILYQKNPSISREHISFLVGQKLDKWTELYSEKPKHSN